VIEVVGHHETIAWPPHFYEAASNVTGLKFTLGAWDNGYKGDLPPGLTNHGVLPQNEFVDTLSRSRVLIGVGTPIACVESSQQQQKLTLLFSMNIF
jgi:hypothetical protein